MNLITRTLIALIALVSAAHAAEFNYGDPVVLDSKDGADIVPVFKDERTYDWAVGIMRERISRGDGIDVNWLQTVAKCIVPVGTKAEFITRMGDYVTVIMDGVPGGCDGVVLHFAVKPAE